MTSTMKFKVLLTLAQLNVIHSRQCQPFVGIVERVTQCIVDSTKILRYVTVEYYCLYYSNIRSYLVEYISRYSDSTYAAV
jgi:hypothetical protein